MTIIERLLHYFSAEYCFTTLGESFKEIRDSITPCATKLKVSADACAIVIKKRNGNS